MSYRKYSRQPLKLEEISFLLWATQGIRIGQQRERIYRVVPSAGCRHSLETYIVTLNVEGLDKGIFRYLPTSHSLVEEYSDNDVTKKIVRCAFRQNFVGTASVVFIWTTLPYRMEWRYGEVSNKVIALDVGHVCQNLYLACEAVKAGTCAIGAYDQEELDEFLGVDGKEEFAIYMGSVGKV